MRAAPGKPSTRQTDGREELADSTNGFCERTPSKRLDEATCYENTHALAQGTASAHSSIDVKRKTCPQRPQHEQPLNTFVAFLQDYANLESRKATQVRDIPGMGVMLPPSMHQATTFFPDNSHLYSWAPLPSLSTAPLSNLYSWAPLPSLSTAPLSNVYSWAPLPSLSTFPLSNLYSWAPLPSLSTAPLSNLYSWAPLV